MRVTVQFDTDKSEPVFSVEFTEYEDSKMSDIDCGELLGSIQSRLRLSHRGLRALRRQTVERGSRKGFVQHTDAFNQVEQVLRDSGVSMSTSDVLRALGPEAPSYNTVRRYLNILVSQSVVAMRYRNHMPMYSISEE